MMFYSHDPFKENIHEQSFTNMDILRNVRVRDNKIEDGYLQFLVEFKDPDRNII